MNLCEVYVLTNWVDWVSYILIFTLAIWKLKDLEQPIENFARRIVNKIGGYK